MLTMAMCPPELLMISQPAGDADQVLVLVIIAAAPVASAVGDEIATSEDDH